MCLTIPNGFDIERPHGRKNLIQVILDLCFFSPHNFILTFESYNTVVFLHYNQKSTVIIYSKS